MAGSLASAASVQDQVLEYEAAGDVAGARALLEQHASSSGQAAQQFAAFLSRHQDPAQRNALLQWADLEKDPALTRLALRQAVLTDFMNGKTADLQADLSRYKQGGGKDLEAPSTISHATQATVNIPGPRAAFARMAALSPDLAPEDLLPALGRNVATSGYQAAGSEVLQQTEYLKLLLRYLGQARELQALTTNGSKIVIPTCDSEQTGNLLKILGYRMRGSCGADIALETVNPTRAFITIDSGFPLSELERDLRANHPFELIYSSTPIPVLYDAAYWTGAAAKSNGSGDFLDAFTSDPSLCRMYLGLSHLEKSVADALRTQVPPQRLRLIASVLDFYGGMFSIKNGSAVVPGSPKGWAELTGASPSSPGRFFERMLSTDDGWLAGYFDALLRLPEGPARTYFTSPEREKRFYDALRGRVSSPGPARPVFRATSDLLLLTQSLRIDPDGTPHVPGGLEVWRNLFIKHPHGKLDQKLSHAAPSWRAKDDLVEALFALSRKTTDNEPLKIFLALNDMDRGRAKPMSAQLAQRLSSDYRNYGAQYRLFAEAPTVSEQSISNYLDLCKQTLEIHDTLLRIDTVGSEQSIFEFWSVAARQQSIAKRDQDATFAAIVNAFAGVKQAADLYPAARTALDTVLKAAGTRADSGRQERLQELLVGPVRTIAEGITSPGERFIRMFDAQDLISLDALFSTQERSGPAGATTVTADAKATQAIDSQLDRLRESVTLRDSLTTEEKVPVGGAYWINRHINAERKLDLSETTKGSDSRETRTALNGLLRDSLVGALYCYYAPPGAQVLLTNPLFVRNHDFIRADASPAYWQATDLSSGGWPSSAGGRLSGSLVSLPYILAETEQNFMTPTRRQALIWADLVPQMVIDVTIPRWRNVTPQQLHWIGLNMERGQTLLAAAALDSQIAPDVYDALQRHLMPGEVDAVKTRMDAGDYDGALAKVPPAAFLGLALEPSLKGKSADLPSLGLEALGSNDAGQVTPAIIGHVFGTPKPTLTHTYTPDILNVRAFPALMGYSSRILAETWESNNLFFAALADQASVPAAMLDSYVPEWNRTAIENIFAANLEDWPSLIRALRATRDSVLHRSAPDPQRASLDTNH